MSKTDQNITLSLNDALALFEQGVLDQAEAELARIASAAAGADDVATELTARRALGDLYRRLKRRDLALVQLQRVVLLMEREGVGRVELAGAINRVGMLLYGDGCYREAALELERSLQLEATLPPEKKAIRWNNLGMVWQEAGDMDRAHTWFSHSVTCFEELDDHRSAAEVYLALFFLELERSGPEVANPMLLAAIERGRDLSDDDPLKQDIIVTVQGFWRQPEASQ